MKKSLGLCLLFVFMLGLTSVSAQDELPFAIGEGDFHWDSLDMLEGLDFSGEEITVLTTWPGEEARALEDVLAYFSQATGATVIHLGSDSMEQQIVIDCAAGSPPDIVGLYQPGLIKELAASDCLVPLGETVTNAVLENYAAGQSWVDLGTAADSNGDSHLYGLVYRSDLKSLVWYVPDEFANAGYEVPTTMEELLALSEQIAADGTTPWCIGIASGNATGWPATDWVEDLLLRTQPPEVYDGWTSNEIPFNDERIVAAIELFGTFARNDAWVAGGAASVGTSDFRESPLGLIAVPPTCYLHRQGSFASNYFPEGTEIGVDVDFFYFPAFAEGDLGQPVMGNGNFFTKTNDREAVAALMEFLTTPLSQEIWMAQGGFLTANTGVNTDLYATDVQRAQGEILLNATTFRFDGSDLMPGAIGTSAFWTGMVDFVSGTSAQEVADNIQAAWDAIKEE
jgi:alpha-glucoside transport system substrate-binding protein